MLIIYVYKILRCMVQYSFRRMDAFFLLGAMGEQTLGYIMNLNIFLRRRIFKFNDNIADIFFN